MSLTVGEILENAKYNLLGEQLGVVQVEMGQTQWDNYKIATELGAKDEDDWYKWKEKVSNYKKEE